jgi:hypothetical protein
MKRRILMKTILDVRVYYPGKPRPEIDERLRGLGLDNWASGYGVEENRRDLAFDNVVLGGDLAYLIEAMPLDGEARIRIVGQQNP